MPVPTWRERCCDIIHDVLQRTKGMPEKDIRKALHDAYPFGERKYYPYKAWLAEIKWQRGGNMREGLKATKPAEGQTSFLE